MVDRFNPKQVLEWGRKERAIRLSDIAAAKAAPDTLRRLLLAKDAARRRLQSAGLSEGQATRAVILARRADEKEDRLMLSAQEIQALRDLPRDGSAVGAMPSGKGDMRETILRGLQKRALVMMWPGRGWCITETGIEAVDAASKQP